LVLSSPTNNDVTSSEVHVSLYATFLLFFSDFNQNQVLQQILVKVQNMKFYETSLGGSRVIVCKGWDRQMDRRDDANRRFFITAVIALLRKILEPLPH